MHKLSIPQSISEYAWYTQAPFVHRLFTHRESFTQTARTTTENNMLRRVNKDGGPQRDKQGKHGKKDSKEAHTRMSHEIKEKERETGARNKGRRVWEREINNRPAVQPTASRGFCKLPSAAGRAKDVKDCSQEKTQLS